MDDSGNARIADFGLATVTQNLDSLRSVQCQHGFSPRWTAPEILNGGTCSKQTDVFSFAMVVIEARHCFVICVELGLLPVRITTDFYRRSSVQ